MKFNQRIAFQPPSDMTGGAGGGGGSKKVWTILGVGCGAVLLVCGLFLAFGGFKVFQCCDAAQGAAVRVQASQAFGQDFVEKLQQGQTDSAFADLSPAYQNKMTKEKLQKLIDDHKPGLESGSPIGIGANANHDANSKSLTDIRNFTMSYSIAQAAGTDSLIIDLEVITVGEDEVSFKVDKIQVGVQERRMDREPPAVEVLDFHRSLQNGNSAFAYGRLSQDFKDKTDVQTFEKFLEDTGSMLTDSQLEIRAIDYVPGGATVMAHASDSTGKNSIVQFELVETKVAGFAAYQIVTIAPMIAEPQEP